jgi:hypothetical protein
MDPGTYFLFSTTRGVANSEVVEPAEEGLTGRRWNRSDGGPQADIPFGPGPRVDRTG